MKAADFDALVKAIGPSPDYSAYNKAIREAREAVYKAERYFGGPVKIAASKARSGGPGSYVVTLTFAPAD
jgi:hypothetical protein